MCTPIVDLSVQCLLTFILVLDLTSVVRPDRNWSQIPSLAAQTGPAKLIVIPN